MKRNILVVAIVLILASCAQDNTDLILISKENGVSQFFKLDNRNNLVPLIKGSLKVADPVLSPDKTQIAFMSEDSGNWNIHIYNLVTEKEMRSASGPSIESFASWSPDGAMLAYMSNRDNNRDIYISDPDGRNEKRITTSDKIDSQPLWSPSGKKRIYFKSLRKEYEGVFYKDIGEDSIHEIAPPGGANDLLNPVPGMPEISFVHKSAKQNNFLIYNEDENQSYSLLSTPARISGYSWGYSAEKLAVSIHGQIEIYTYSDSSGLSLDFVIPNAAYPAWSTNDDYLYYDKRVEGILQIFRYNLEKDIEKQITHGTADCTDAVPY